MNDMDIEVLESAIDRTARGIRWGHAEQENITDALKSIRSSLAVPEERRTVAPDVDGQDFYELCQQYRHGREMMPPGIPTVVQAFNNLREYIKTGNLPWPSYQRDDGPHSLQTEKGEK